MSNRTSIAVFYLFTVTCGAVAQQPQTMPGFVDQVQPILELKCGKCHGPEKQEARIRFDQLTPDLSENRAVAQTWREALNAINAAEMPPEGEPPLTASEREAVTQWISGSIEIAIARQRSSGGRMVLRRLNRTQFQHTMFDLLGVDMDYARDLPPDGDSPSGFRNHGASQHLSALELEYFLATARRAMERVIVVGPPPQVYRHHFRRSNVTNWRGPTEVSNRLERAQKFLVRMVDDYPESGEFRIRIQARAELRPQKGYPLLEVAVGYRPDTEVHFRVAEVKEVVSEDLQQFEFRGRIENFPLPVRGQGKFPGLVVRLRNVYDDGSPIPTKLETIDSQGNEVKAFRPERHLPALLIESLEFEGPVYAQWPPRHHRQILFESELREENELRYVRHVLERFMARAYRRPPTVYQLEDMLSFFASIRPDFTRFEDAIRETLAMVLIQPDFLFLLEPAGDPQRNIDDWELASRLSFFLWDSMPDRQLLDLASQGLLRRSGVLEAQVHRMLDDPRAGRFVTAFVTQWLHLDNMDGVPIDSERFPAVDDTLKQAMKAETIEFFAELLHSGESALNLLDSDFTMLNERLARHYGVDGVFGREVRRTELRPSHHRGGLLGQASLLLTNSTGRESHPIRRAVFVRDRLLGDPPAPPPPNVPALDDEAPGFVDLSVREQLRLHRAQEACASCHRDIDPWGIALERFDAVGRWRTEIVTKDADGNLKSKSVMAEDVLPDGTRLGSDQDLKDYLRKNRGDDFSRNLVRNLLIYAVGRSLELSDEAEVNVLVEQFRANGCRLSALIQRLVASPAFLTK